MSTLQMTKLTLAEEVEMHAQLRSGAGRGGGEGPGSLRAEVHLRARGVRGCAPGGGMEERGSGDAETGCRGPGLVPQVGSRAGTPRPCHCSSG